MSLVTHGLLFGYTCTGLVLIIDSSQNFTYDVTVSTSSSGSVQLSVNIHPSSLLQNSHGVPVYYHESITDKILFDQIVPKVVCTQVCRRSRCFHNTDRLFCLDGLGGKVGG